MFTLSFPLPLLGRVPCNSAESSRHRKDGMTLQLPGSPSLDASDDSSPDSAAGQPSAAASPTAPAGRLSAIAIVDSDSYTKWGVSVLAAMPGAWDKKVILIHTAVAPSEQQLAAAIAGTGFEAEDIESLAVADVIQAIRDARPDVVLVSMLGPAATVVMRDIHAMTNRPVMLTGLPGISIPATEKAILRRVQADLFLLHSKREVRAFDELAIRLGVPGRFALGRLPFMTAEAVERHPGTDIIFAAQAAVPAVREDRVRLLGWLAELATRHPQNRVIIKLRAVRGEAQTHAELDSYEELLDELAATPEGAPQNLVVASGPMLDYLQTAKALVTLSSTAAIEAIALGVPVLAIDEFGVGPELINEVFIGSGLLANADALVDARFASPHPDWLDDNYFHDAADNDWLDQLDGLVQQRSLGTLPDRQPLTLRKGGALRRAWDRHLEFGELDQGVMAKVAIVVGVPARQLLRMARWVRRTGRTLARGKNDLDTEQG